MSSRLTHGIVGLLLVAVIKIASELCVDLLAGAVGQEIFKNQFDTGSIVALALLSLVGFLLGSWLGAEVELKAVPNDSSQEATNAGTTTVTRLRALRSYARLRGSGIHLSDVLMVGSQLDIETED